MLPVTVRTLMAVCALLPAASGQVLPPGSAVRPRLLDLNVVALDSHGQPVTDLTAADFQVTDAGKPQHVIFFRHNDGRLQRSTALGPREFSNRENRPAHATVILLDLLNDSMGAAGAAGAQLVQAVSRLEAGQDLYLYLLTKAGSLYPVRGLPEEGTPNAGEARWTAQIKSLLEAGMKATFGLRPIDMDVGTRVGVTYAALGQLAGRLGAISGRKNIVWITHGVPIEVTTAGDGRSTGVAGPDDYVDFQPYLRRLCAAVNRSNVAIYPVMQTPPGMAMEGTPEARYSGLGSQDTLQQFAELTGGRSKGAGDIGGTIRQAINDVRTSYQLGYYPLEENWDGKYHKLRVTCARKGVRIQSKTGYFAWPEAPADAKDAIDAAVFSANDAGEIGLRVHAGRSAADPQVVHLELRIDAGDIALLQEGGQYTAELQIVLAGFEGNGLARTAPPVPLALHFTEAQREEALKNGVAFAHDAKLSAAVQSIRLVVLDQQLGVAGSVTMPVQRLH